MPSCISAAAASTAAAARVPPVASAAAWVSASSMKHFTATPKRFRSGLRIPVRAMLVSVMMVRPLRMAAIPAAMAFG